MNVSVWELQRFHSANCPTVSSSHQRLISFLSAFSSMIYYMGHKDAKNMYLACDCGLTIFITEA